MKNNIKATTVLQRNSSGVLMLLPSLSTIMWMQSRVNEIKDDEKHTLVLNQIKKFEDQYMKKLIDQAKLNAKIYEAYSEDLDNPLNKDCLDILNKFYDDIINKDIHFDDYSRDDIFNIVISLNTIAQSYSIDYMDFSICEKIYDEISSDESFDLEWFIDTMIDNNNFIINNMADILKEDIGDDFDINNLIYNVSSKEILCRSYMFHHAVAMSEDIHKRYGEQMLVKLNVLAGGYKDLVNNSHRALEEILSFSSDDETEIIKRTEKINSLNENEFLAYTCDDLDNHKWKSTVIISPSIVDDDDMIISMLVVDRGYYTDDLNYMNYSVSHLISKLCVGKIFREVKSILFMNRVFPLLENANEDNINDIIRNSLLDIVDKSYIIDILSKSVKKVSFDIDSLLADPNISEDIKDIISRMKAGKSVTQEELNIIIKIIADRNVPDNTDKNDDIVFN